MHTFQLIQTKKLLYQNMLQSVNSLELTLKLHNTNFRLCIGYLNSIKLQLSFVSSLPVSVVPPNHLVKIFLLFLACFRNKLKHTTIRHISIPALNHARLYKIVILFYKQLISLRSVDQPSVYRHLIFLLFTLKFHMIN